MVPEGISITEGKSTSIWQLDLKVRAEGWLISGTTYGKQREFTGNNTHTHSYIFPGQLLYSESLSLNK